MRTLFLILTFLFLKVFSAHALPEDQLKEAFQSKLLPFLKTGETFRFEGERGQLLAGVRFVHGADIRARGTIVVLPGRSEAYLKYVEVIYDLYAQGYDLYSYDHRGQGLSPHLSARNAQIGHLDQYSNYVRDLDAFTSRVVQPKARGPLFLLAHSMGGGIAARYLIEHPGVYASAVFSAPMMDINTKPYPRWVARLIVGGATFIGLGNRYAIGYGDYDSDLPIENNAVTHSVARAWMQDELTRENPEIAVGGPSNKWVKESLRETRRTERRVEDLTTPLLILQAGEDLLVRLDAQDRACEAAAQCKIHEFPTAKHEILMETDSVRDEAMTAVSDFFR